MRLTEERLISIATGESEPTADELVILNEDYAARQMLEEYRRLFADLEGMPAQEIPAVEMQKILPGVREEIRSRPFWRRWLDLSPLVSTRGWSAAAVAMTFFLFILLPALQSPGLLENNGLGVDELAYVGISAEESFYYEQDGLDAESLITAIGENQDAGYDESMYETLYGTSDIFTQVAALNDEEMQEVTAELRQALSLEENRK